MACFLGAVLTENFRHVLVGFCIGPCLVLQVAILLTLLNDVEQIGIDDTGQIHGLDIGVVRVGRQRELPTQ